MKAKKKINYGWVFMLICIAILLFSFFMKNRQMKQARSSLLENTNRYYKVTTDAFSLTGSELEALKKVSADSETQLRAFAEETAQNHWEAIAPEIAPLFLDEQTLERHAEAFQDLFKSNIKNQQILVNIELNIDEKPTFKWNLLNQVKITSYYRMTYKLDDELSNEFFKTTAPLYANDMYVNDDIIWEKTNNGFKISQAGWLTSQIYSDFYKPY